MTGIYCIEHVASKRKYVGFSNNVKRRWSYHRNTLKNKNYHYKYTSDIHEIVQKEGIGAFNFYMLEHLPATTSWRHFLTRETYWIEYHNSHIREFGFNKSKGVVGKNNSNYGRKWSDEQKEKMSLIAKKRHASGNIYGENFKRIVSEKAKKRWEDTSRREAVSKKVTESKEKKHAFFQYTREGVFIRRWDTMREILEVHTDYKWQNVYAACNGNKPTYRGFLWKMVKKEM